MLPCGLLRLAPAAPRRRALSPSLPQRVVCTGCRLSYAGEGAALSPRCLGHAQVSDATEPRGVIATVCLLVWSTSACKRLYAGSAFPAGPQVSQGLEIGSF